MNELLGQFGYNLDSLRLVPILYKSLEDPAPIVLEAHLLVFSADQFDAFVYEYMLLSITHFSLLDEQLVVIDSQFLDQIGYLLLLTTVQGGLLVSFRRVLFVLLVFTAFFFFFCLQNP